MADETIDTTNKFMAGSSLGKKEITFMLPVPRQISHADALTLAAYLVALADPDDQFENVLDAVLNAQQRLSVIEWAEPWSLWA